MRALATAFASICVVLQTRKTFQWQLLPVMASVWPPGTICRTSFSFETCAMASANAELTLPSRKLTLSPSISLRAFCTAVPASPLVESSTRSSSGDGPGRLALRVDLVDRHLAADEAVLAGRGVGAGQRIVQADLDRIRGAGGNTERTGEWGGGERRA